MSLARDWQDEPDQHTVDLVDLAERALLGAVMILGNLRLVPPGLRPEDFASAQHQSLYRAMLLLETDEMSVDLVTVAYRVRQDAGLREAVGVSYISALIDRVPDVTAIPSYARIVMEEAAKRRRLKWAS